MGKIRAILVRPREKAEVRMIENKLETYQSLVKGRIFEFDPFYFELGEEKKDIAFICNDDGHFSGLPACRMLYDVGGIPESVIYGPFVIVRCDVAKGVYCSFTDQQIQEMIDLLGEPHWYLDD